MLGRLQDNDSDTQTAVSVLSVLFVWVTGLVSTIYLVGNALFLLFLSVVFGSGRDISTLDYLEIVEAAAIPAFCFAAIGVTGLKLLPSGRFWVLGLSAIVVETMLALYVFADPENMLTLADLPSKVIHATASKKKSN